MKSKFQTGFIVAFEIQGGQHSVSTKRYHYFSEPKGTIITRD